MKRRRRRVKSFEDHMADMARQCRERAKELPPSLERDALLNKARQADVAIHLYEWINSWGLQSPD